MRLHLVRHLPTELNQRKILQGSLDIPISRPTDEILQQIEKNKAILENIKLDRIYCSELIRTQETAKLYGYQDFETAADVNELNFGTFEGGPKANMKGEILKLWMENPKKLVLGESLLAFFSRIDNYINENIDLEDVLCFSHGAVMRYLKARYVYENVNLMNKLQIKNNELLCINIKK